MSTPMPADQILSDVSSLQSKVNWLQDSARLKNTLNTVAQIQTEISGLPNLITKLRTNGYVFEKSLESQATNIASQWQQIYPSVTTRINSETATLQGALNVIENRMTQLNGLATNPSSALPLLLSVQSDVQNLENAASSAESAVESMYTPLNNELESFRTHLNEIDNMLVQIAEAKFTLLPTEGGLRAVKAVWFKNGTKRDDDPEGVFYLTDQRLLFEQKQEVATKKILFITTAKEKIQELKWEIPIGLVEQVTPSKQGMLKNEDHLELQFGSGAQLGSVHLHLWGEGNQWLQTINRAKIHDFDADRVVAIDPAAQAKVMAAPAICPSCGGNINQTILRGQDSIKCEYCGFMIRL